MSTRDSTLATYEDVPRVPSFTGDAMVAAAPPPPPAPEDLGAAIIRALLDASPQTFGALGGIAGGGGGLLAGPAAPVAVPFGMLVGGGAGQAAGENIRQIGYRGLGLDTPAPWSPEALSRLASAFKSGAEQEGMGLLLPGGASSLWNTDRKKALAENMMAGALKPGPKILSRSRTVVRDALDEGLSISRANRMQGEARARSLLDESHAAEDAIAAKTMRLTRGPDGVVSIQGRRTWTPREILNRARERMATGAPRNARLTATDSPQWQQMEDEFLATYSDAPEAYMAHNPGALGKERPFSVEDMLRAKRQADKTAWDLHMQSKDAALRETAGRGDARERFYKTIADVMRDELRREVPALGPQMKRTSRLMGLQRAEFKAEAATSQLKGSTPFSVAIREAFAAPAQSARAVRLWRSAKAGPTVTERAGFKGALRGSPRAAALMSAMSATPYGSRQSRSERDRMLSQFEDAAP